MTKAGATYYYHLNGHGDVVALTDASGNVVAQYEYDAWGNIVSKTGALATANPYRYAGYYYDEETGLYYLMARYYDANMGRFITRDTFHGFENEPQSLNQYVYTKNNPVMYVDPSGHFSVRQYVSHLPRWVQNLLRKIFPNDPKKVAEGIAVKSLQWSMIGAFTGELVVSVSVYGKPKTYKAVGKVGAMAGAVFGANAGAFAAAIPLTIRYQIGVYLFGKKKD